MPRLTRDILKRAEVNSGKSLVRLVGVQPANILRRLSPTLIDQLAELEGSSQKELTSALRQMPFGHRIMLHAHRCLDHDENGRAIALPLLGDIAHAAAVVRHYQ
jgi:hypothetical protein